MNDLTIPAPFWRRLLAGVYDGLLLLSLWLAAAVIDYLVRDLLLGLPRQWLWMRVYFFAVALAFFGWFWVRGGQTLGMRAWRLQVRRLDGSGLRWPIATLRLIVLLPTWYVVSMPLALLIPAYARAPLAQGAAMICGLLSLIVLILMLVDSRRRAPCDWVAGTEVVKLPKK